MKDDYSQLLIDAQKKLNIQVKSIGDLKFLQEDIISQQLIKTSYAGNIEVPTFRLQGHLVWGATAMMLSEVRFMIKNNI